MTVPVEDARQVEFDDAISLTGYGKYHFLVVLVGGGCIMCAIIETMNMMMVIPAAQCDLDLDLSEKGLLSSMSFLGVVSSSHFWGFLADTKGRRTVLLLCLLLSASTSLIGAFVKWVWLFILLRFLNGAFIAGATGISYAYVGEFFNNKTRPKVISWMALSVPLGSVYLPLVAWCILTLDWHYDWGSLIFKPWRLYMILCALPSIIFALILLNILPESPKFLLMQSKDNQSKVLEIMKTIYAFNSGNSKDEYPVLKIISDESNSEEGNTDKEEMGTLKLMWVNTSKLFMKPYLTATILISFLQFGIFLSSAGVNMWYPMIVNSITHYSDEFNTNKVGLCQAIAYEKNKSVPEIGVKVCSDTIKTEVFSLNLLIGALYALKILLMGFIISRIGKKKLLIAILVVGSSLGIIGQLISNSILVELFIGDTILMAGGLAIVYAIVVDVYPTQIRGMATAIGVLFCRLGAMTGAQIVGPMLFNICDYIFYIFAVYNLVLVLIVLVLPEKPKKLIKERDCI